MFYVVIIELFIVCDDCQILNERLRYNQPIKWIIVMGRKTGSFLDM